MVMERYPKTEDEFKCKLLRDKLQWLRDQYREKLKASVETPARKPISCYEDLKVLKVE